MAILKHCKRELPKGKTTFSNEAIDINLSHNNVSLINKDKSAKEINQLRKQLLKDMYVMKRADIIHAIEVVAQCPNNCPEEQKDLFFIETLNFVKEQFGLTGENEKYVLLAEVHKDERVFVKNSSDDNSSSINISKDHIHILFMPITIDQKADKHKNTSGLKLNADSLTKKKFLKQLHPSYQSYLTSKNINATVYSNNAGTEKKLGLSVRQLKELTQRTGIVLDKSLTIEELGNIIKNNIELKKELELAQEKIKELEKTQEQTHNVWGNSSSSWGTTNNWGQKTNTIDIDEKLY